MNSFRPRFPTHEAISDNSIQVQRLDFSIQSIVDSAADSHSPTSSSGHASRLIASDCIVFGMSESRTEDVHDKSHGVGCASDLIYREARPLSSCRSGSSSLSRKSSHPRPLSILGTGQQDHRREGGPQKRVKWSLPSFDRWASQLEHVREISKEKDYAPDKNASPPVRR